jgi:hypothetical protein
VGCFDGKGANVHPWGLKIKPHKLHSCGQWCNDRVYLTQLSYLT